MPTSCATPATLFKEKPPPGGAFCRRASSPAEAQQAADGFWVVLGKDLARSAGASRR